MKKQKKLSPPTHTHYDLGLLIVLIALVVFATAIVGSLTGASVYYQTKTTPIIKNPNAAPAKNLDVQVLNVNKINTQTIAGQSGTPLQISSSQGINLESDLTVQPLAGMGNAYACVDEQGQLYRSEQPCI